VPKSGAVSNHRPATGRFVGADSEPFQKYSVSCSGVVPWSSVVLKTSWNWLAVSDTQIVRDACDVM
jgi:hypothetical protein